MIHYHHLHYPITLLLYYLITLLHYRTDAMDLFNRMEKQYGVKPNGSTYRTLVRMHILNKDVTSAMKIKEDMVR